MNELELRSQIRELKAELETRYKTGTVKIATADGTPIPTLTIQNQLFALNYKLSKLLTAADDELASTKTPQFP